jgi:hypothetical protein
VQNEREALDVSPRKGARDEDGFVGFEMRPLPEPSFLGWTVQFGTLKRATAGKRGALNIFAP